MKSDIEDIAFRLRSIKFELYFEKDNEVGDLQAACLDIDSAINCIEDYLATKAKRRTK